MSIQFGRVSDFDVALVLQDELETVPAEVRGVSVVVISISLQKHSPERVASMLREMHKIDKCGQRVFLTIEDYDHDSRELYDIPECNAWAEKLVYGHLDSMRSLADERVCQHCDDPHLRSITADTIGRSKLVVMAGMGHLKWTGPAKFDLQISDQGMALLDSVGVEVGHA